MSEETSDTNLNCSAAGEPPPILLPTLRAKPLGRKRVSLHKHILALSQEEKLIHQKTLYADHITQEEQVDDMASLVNSSHTIVHACTGCGKTCIAEIYYILFQLYQNSVIILF
ncbi:uncharacterized protein VP01_2288g3 [Puccinia sorghi]|uniref:Uncharacterized protein n=1 Tax=Puccinia sorghi TaxID=27349 RepID=A0A0L6V8S1_9BASI|nr:uncharacterized protein VP01_2288g3 [Puccinia sorghi]